MTIPQQLLPHDNYPYSYLSQRVSPPEDQVGVNSFKVNGEFEENLRQAVEEMSYIANFHLSKARALQSKVPKNGRACLIPVIPSIYFLSKLDEAKYNIWEPSLYEPSRFAIMALMARTWLTGVF